MRTFPDTIKFKYPWRDYQERVLNDLTDHLTDKKLHVIAPPGSGKTILGLEVVRRLNRPTIILSPTIAIRNQWKDRFVDLFMSKNEGQAKWISQDLHKPNLLTLSSYQALYAILSGREEDEDDAEEESEEKEQKAVAENKERRSKFIRSLKRSGIKVLVVDECHHLKNEWWKNLTFLCDNIDDITVISLTATPPYDVSSAEWQRYSKFCGPVDAEISVPELVREGDLCPHQDFIYFSNPIRQERSLVNDFHKEVIRQIDDLKSDTMFRETVLQHPFVTDCKNNIERILENPSFFASILVYLKRVGVEVDRALYKILSSSKKDIPSMSLEWFEILLTGLFYGDEEHYKQHKEYLGKIESNLKRLGAIERRTVTLLNNQKISKLLSQSISKLESILRIVDIEQKAAGNVLRLVVLTDYIRQEELGNSNGEGAHTLKIGVIPIFNSLRDRYKSTLPIGVLSGTVVIIPKEAFRAFRQTSLDYGIPRNKIISRECPADRGYLIVENVGEFKNKIVRTMTNIFEAGHIKVLIGTKSLLGEGWDSPSINSLILASCVGSFVLSNQMRGRAIRSQSGNPKKVSNIWHLVCNDPFAPSGGNDVEMLTRRFSAFLGISNSSDVIEKGFDRLDLGKPPYSESTMDQINQKMVSVAGDRDSIRRKWEISLKTGGALSELIKTPRESIPKGFVFNRTIRALLLQGLYAGGYTAADLLRSMRVRNDSEYLWNILMVAFVAGFIVALPKTLKCLYLYFRNGPIEGAVKSIGRVVLDSLKESDIIKTDYSKLKVITEYGNHGAVFCFLEGATYYEASQFRAALLEILGPIENPRYLVLRKSLFFNIHRTDYHSVPAILGQKKASAKMFYRKWRDRIGLSRLIYTRTIEGRRVLVKARGYSLSSAFIPQSEVISKWR